MDSAAKKRFVPTTEGFYDTASHRSQQVSQHQAVYQKETTLPKRRCPRRGKPKRATEVVKRRKPNDCPTTKPWPCVKTMLSDIELTEDVANFEKLNVGPALRTNEVTHAVSA